jgi:hypothetical protein
MDMSIADQIAALECELEYLNDILLTEEMDPDIRDMHSDRADDIAIELYELRKGY